MKALLKVQYMGTAYCGFQCQKNGASIQEVLTRAAGRVFGMPCSVTGCSRTDAGVHALGYVCAVAPADGARGADWCTVPPGKIHRAFAPHLPPDISVCAAAFAPDFFHPRYDAVEKEYIYQIWDAPWETPFFRDRSYHSVRKISPEGLSQMQAAAAAYIGRHDFRAFMAGSAERDTVRTVTRAQVRREGEHMLVFSVSADGFLYNMVRIMAGTLLEVAAGRMMAGDIPMILEMRDRSHAGFTAPPHGLYLREVRYPEEILWQCE